ncbi:MAG: crossover junction endodeoxyribonuclease RuvC [Bacteroidota bacterium]
MIVLGVDPGTLITGYGVVAAERGTLTLLAAGIIRNRGTRSMPLRLKSIYDGLKGVIEQHAPDEFAIETAFYGKNAQSALKIGQARGVAILAAVHREIPTSEYAPRAVKKAVTGNGAASKEQVQYMVRTILRLRTVPKELDASDAVAVALCHLTNLQPRTARGRVTQDWKSYIANHPGRVVRPR